MLRYKKILVARDFSASSDRALGYALELAERSGGEVHTLFAEVIHGPPAPPREEQAAYRERADRLVVSRAVVRDVAPAPAILHYAEEHGVDLIVMGTHGRRGLQRLLMGSVAEEVVRLSSCPVFTVHADGAEEMPALRDVLVPIDFSSYSRVALEEAIVFAREFDAGLDLLHIIEEPLHPAFYNTGVFSIYDVQPDIEVKVERHLKELFEEVGAPEVAVRYHVRPGHAAREIVSFATERHDGMIVTATHGLTGLEHLLIGSVAEKVTRMAPCPVLVVKPIETPRSSAAGASAAAAL